MKPPQKWYSSLLQVLDFVVFHSGGGMQWHCRYWAWNEWLQRTGRSSATSSFSKLSSLCWAEGLFPSQRLQPQCLMGWARSKSDQNSLALPLAFPFPYVLMAITTNSRAGIDSVSHTLVSSCPFNSGAQWPRALELFLSYGKCFLPQLFTLDDSAQFTLLKKKKRKKQKKKRDL